MSAITPLVPWFARLIDTYEKYAAAATTYWQSTTSYKATCPAGKRWFILAMNSNRSQAATLSVQMKDASGNTILQMDYDAAGTGAHPWPSIVAVEEILTTPALPLFLDPGYYIDVTFGAAQDVNAYMAILFLEVDI